jgi:hypothetical protein
MITRSKTETVVTEICLYKRDLIELLQRIHPDLPEHGTSITIHISGGGDWSESNLELKERAISVKYKTEVRNLVELDTEGNVIQRREDEDDFA